MESEPGVITINPQTFLDMCPALVYQLDQRSCYKTEIAPAKLDKKWSKCLLVDTITLIAMVQLYVNSKYDTSYKINKISIKK